MRYAAFDSPGQYGEACRTNPVTCKGKLWENFSEQCCETIRQSLQVEKCLFGKSFNVYLVHFKGFQNLSKAALRTSRPAAMVLLAMAWLSDNIVARRCGTRLLSRHRDQILHLVSLRMSTTETEHPEQV